MLWHDVVLSPRETVLFHALVAVLAAAWRFLVEVLLTLELVQFVLDSIFDFLHIAINLVPVVAVSEQVVSRLAGLFPLIGLVRDELETGFTW